MILYFNQENIDDRIISKAIHTLDNDGLIAYPTDSSWAIGCSSLSKLAIDKLKKLKGVFRKVPITLICSHISQITDIAELSNSNFKIIKRYTPGPYVFILRAQSCIEKVVNMKRVEIGVRIPSSKLLNQIIERYGHPIFSITASKKMIGKSNSDDEYNDFYKEENLFDYGCEIEEIKEVDLILDSGEELPKVFTTVVSLLEEELQILRQGVGVL